MLSFPRKKGGVVKVLQMRRESRQRAPKAPSLIPDFAPEFIFTGLFTRCKGVHWLPKKTFKNIYLILPDIL